MSSSSNSKKNNAFATIKPVKDRVVIDMSRDEALDLFRDLTLESLNYNNTSFFTRDLNLALRKFFGNSKNESIEINNVYDVLYGEF